MKRKKKRLTRHHNLAKQRRGKRIPTNIFYLTPEHHSCFHQLFGNRTLMEASIVLRKLSEKRRPLYIMENKRVNEFSLKQ